MSTPTPSEYLEAGCTLCNASMGVFLAILVLTNKKPCTECPYKKGCEAHKKLFSVNHATYNPPIYTEMVRDEAKRRGVSIGQVRRERKNECNT